MHMEHKISMQKDGYSSCVRNIVSLKLNHNIRRIIILVVILIIFLGIGHYLRSPFTENLENVSHIRSLFSKSNKNISISSSINPSTKIIVPKLRNPRKEIDQSLKQLIEISKVKLEECPDGRYSRNLRVLIQRNWENNETSLETDSNSSFPLIVYGPTSEIFHKINTSGCRYKCRYSTKSEDYANATLAVYTRYWGKQFVTLNDNKLWAFETNESPTFTHLPPESVKSKFSIFVTPSADSLVPWPYGLFVPFEKPHCLISDETRERMAQEDSTRYLPIHHELRNNTIAWVISNTYGTQRREKKYSELASLMKIDRYGSGHLPCGHLMDVNCFENLTLNYKFLLTFENSYCDEYITEKLFKNALRYGMVPIVYGAPSDNYFDVAPPNSYIDINDFTTTENLVDYIKWLDKNVTAYASYFAWKKYGQLAKKSRVDCRLCGVLHNILDGKLDTQKDQFNRFNDAKTRCH